VNTVAFAPIPSVSASTATADRAGFLRIIRNPKEMSCASVTAYYFSSSTTTDFAGTSTVKLTLHLSTPPIAKKLIATF